MSRCSAQCCSGCRDEIREERRIRKAEIHSVAACTAGDLPELLRDDDDEPEFEEGDHMFATGLKGPMEEVQATTLPSLNGWLRLSSGIANWIVPPQFQMCQWKVSQIASESSTLCSQKSLLMSSPTTSRGTTLSNLSPERRPPAVRCTPFLLPSRRNWTLSSKRN